MKRRRYLAVLSAGCLSLLCTAFFGGNRICYGYSEAEPGIKDIVVCNVYWEDFKSVGLQSPNVSKFVVTFRSFQPVDPRLIDSLTVDGPNGYFFEFRIAPYTRRTLNGFIGYPRWVWFMGFERRGFLENGRYTITLKYKSGNVSVKSRVLNYTDSLLAVYKNTPLSFSPSSVLAPSTPLDRVTLKWTVLPRIDAYYQTRLGKYSPGNASGSSSPWIFQDTIFGYGEGNPRNTGLNKDHVTVGRPLERNARYYWFTEILDSNDLNRINIAIFQAMQSFRIPAR